ncbi:hypothetical protein [Thiohalocapsa sp. ML1]|uniref:hypothetical protein n=1 Tax=Thiohalocapsa sp. ML1 TaxID=1431688 RepID=UPI000731FC40|nr:hypothetical protein [Thiohalocapsa sp. ML1]
MHAVQDGRWTWAPLASGLLGLLLGLTACGPQIVYDLTPPETPEGRVCTVQCQSSAALCRQMQQNAEQQCQNNYALMQQNYQACRDSGSKHCVMPPYCTSLSTSVCDQSFRECFAACGGTVTTRVIERK